MLYKLIEDVNILDESEPVLQQSLGTIGRSGTMLVGERFNNVELTPV